MLHGNTSNITQEKTIVLPNYENLATKGAPNPVIIPRDDMSITDFYEFPEEYKEVLESAKSVGRLEFYGKADFGSYVDRAVQKILTDSNADPETEFAEAQKHVAKKKHWKNSMKQIRNNITGDTRSGIPCLMVLYALFSMFPVFFRCHSCIMLKCFTE